MSILGLDIGTTGVKAVAFREDGDINDIIASAYREYDLESPQPGHLELYRRLLQIREGEPLAELIDGHCQACFVQIPKNLGVRLARGNELVQCPSCDRILFLAV